MTDKFFPVTVPLAWEIPAPTGLPQWRCKNRPCRWDEMKWDEWYERSFKESRNVRKFVTTRRRWKKKIVRLKILYTSCRAPRPNWLTTDQRSAATVQSLSVLTSCRRRVPAAANGADPRAGRPEVLASSNRCRRARHVTGRTRPPRPTSADWAGYDVTVTSWRAAGVLKDEGCWRSCLTTSSLRNDSHQGALTIRYRADKRYSSLHQPSTAVGRRHIDGAAAWRVCAKRCWRRLRKFVAVSATFPVQYQFETPKGTSLSESASFEPSSVNVRRSVSPVVKCPNKKGIN